MNYSDSIDYLFSLQRMGARLGTATVRDLLRRVGDPQRSYPSVLVAGTNGKGSTASFLASIFKAAGVKAGLYTSPHLIRFEERIRVDGEMIPPESVARLTTQLRKTASLMLAGTADSGGPTFFETATAMAFKHFEEQEVDLAILEVGMGGRLDATGVVNAATCLFAPIDLDHREQLGETLREVASEKACILRGGSRALTGAQPPPVMDVLREAAIAREAILLRAEQFWRYGEGKGGTIDLHSTTEPVRRLEGIRLSLPGRHQRINAVLATACATTFPDLSDRVTDQAIRSGLTEARWPGRCQVLDERPILLLDGAHNPSAARALRHFLVEEFTSKGQALVLVFGAMQDKDLKGMMGCLFPLARRVFVTRAETPRAADPMMLAAAGRRFNPELVPAPSLSAALSAARLEAGPEGVVCVCGSLYLVGDVLAIREGLAPRTRQAL